MILEKVGQLLSLASAGLAGSLLAGEPIVDNGGFEETRDGGTVGWKPVGRQYSYVDGMGRNGTRALAFENDDPAFYAFPGQTVKLQPGQCYCYEVWIRTEDLKGPDSGGASICVEWTDADGKWIGGDYAATVKGTSGEWKLVRSVTPRIPENAASVQIHPYVHRGMCGKAWFDDVSVTPYRARTVDGLYTDAYRDTAAEGRVVFKAALNLEPKLDLAQVSGTMSWTDADGGARTSPVDSLTHDGAAWAVEAADLRLGRQTVTFALSRADGSIVGTAERAFTRVGTLPEQPVRFDRLGRTIVDGQPFFPLGMYFDSVRDARRLDAYAKGPFNCLMPYSCPDQDGLDRCREKGLKVIYSLASVYSGTQWAPSEVKTEADEVTYLEKLVGRYKDHPALLAWYLNDERPLTWLRRLTSRQQLMERLDPGHPCWSVLYQYNEIRDYLGTFDVVGTDPYPIPLAPASMATKWTRDTAAGTLGLKPVWQVPQAFDWAAYRKTPEERAKCRAPTKEELRSMTWQCIAAGANGLVYYSYFDLEKQPNGVPFARRWEEVCDVAAEVKAQFHVLLAADPAPSVTGAPETLGVRTWGEGEAAYLLAVNTTDAPCSATLKLSDRFVLATPVFGPAPQLADESLSVSLAPLEPLLVRLDRRAKGELVVTRNADGSIVGMGTAGDAHGMNWVQSADRQQYSWIGPEFAWGTGTLRIDGVRQAWSKPGPVGGALELRTVSRLEPDGTLYERREFVNVSDRPVSLSEIDIHTPFNDNYPRHPGEMYGRRCHAHVWAGGESAWVCAMRIGASAPHLGLAVVEGAVSAFEMKERGWKKDLSNTRGILALSPPDAVLAPGEGTAVAWRVFPHRGWDDFFRRLVACGGVDAKADRYVLRVGETTRIEARTSKGSVTRDWTCPAIGEQTVEVACADGRKARVELLGVADPEALLLARARFIVARQQVNLPGTPYDGALVPYDNEAERQERRWEDNLELDHSEGGERIGMGVFLAMMAQRGHRDEFLPALLRYYRFCRHSLQDADGTSRWGVGQKWTRTFNYSWLVRFYLEMHALTGERQYLDDAYGTLKRLYGGDLRVPAVLVAYPLGQSLRAFRQAGMSKEADDLLAWGRRHLGPIFAGPDKVTGTEVNMSPERLSGAMNMLFDFADTTGESAYREAVRRWMPLAEAICGRQPTWHAHDIGLHHWDGFWFGKRQCWGDTLPHDWNGDMAVAFMRYAAAFGEKAYARRAIGIADAMLGLFTPDGRGSCAYIYPDRVEGAPGRFFDPLANDQDWALVFYMMTQPYVQGVVP